MARNLEMAVGLHKGHKTTKTVQKAKPSRRKGVRRLDSVIVAFLNLNLNVLICKGQCSSCSADMRCARAACAKKQCSEFVLVI